MKTYITRFSERPSYFADRLFFERYHGATSGPILEIGCSIGHFMQFGSERKIGIDLDLAALSIARREGFSVLQSDVQRALPFRDNTFASIDCQHVIEHVQDPLALMKECRRVLRPGGKLVVVTPNIARIGFKFFVDYTHRRPFTRESLINIAVDSGFEPIEVGFTHRGVLGSKFLHSRGLLSVQAALRLQTILYRLGSRARENLVLIGEKPDG